MFNTETVINFLRKNGPSLPVEIGKTLGFNSLLTNAVLSDLIIRGQIKRSVKSIGSSFIYYLQGQEDAMRAKLVSELSIQEKNLLQKIKNSVMLPEEQLNAHDRQFINSVRDFIKIIKRDNKNLIALCNTPEPAASKPVIKLEVKQELKPEAIEKETEGDFNSSVINRLKKLGEIINEKVITKGKESEYLLRIKTVLGEQELFVKSKNKSRVNETDLSMIYTQALKLKKPAILITNGSLTKSAEKWAKENTGELLKVIKL